MLIDLNMNPSPQDGFIVAQYRSFLKPRRSGKSGTSQIVSFEHAKVSAALAASCKRASRKSEGALNLFSLSPKRRRQFINSNKLLGNSQTLQCFNLFSYCFSGKPIRGRD